MRIRWTRRQMRIGAALGLLLVAGIAVTRAAHPPVHSARVAKAVYYCPMHPGYTSDRPGDCPICNMKLVLRQTGVVSKDVCVLHNCPMAHEGRPCPMLVVAKEGEKVICPVCGAHPMETAAPLTKGAPAGYAAILLSPQKRQLVGIKTALVQRKRMTKTIRTPGRIAHDPELYQAEEEYLQALRASRESSGTAVPEMAEQARRLVEASRLRLQLLGLSEMLIDRMREWEKPDRSLLVPGSDGRVWLYAPIYEFELPLVREGQEVTVESPALGGKTLRGVVQSVDTVLDPMTRSARVRAILTDSEALLKPEMYVNVSLEVVVGDVLSIPREAVLDTGTKRIAFVDKGEGLLEPRELTLGSAGDGEVEVKAGVTEGEAVVTSGNFLIDSESRLKAALEGMTSPPAASAEGGGHPHGR